MMNVNFAFLIFLILNFSDGKNGTDEKTDTISKMLDIIENLIVSKDKVVVEKEKVMVEKEKVMVEKEKAMVEKEKVIANNSILTMKLEAAYWQYKKIFVPFMLRCRMESWEQTFIRSKVPSRKIMVQKLAQIKGYNESQHKNEYRFQSWLYFSTCCEAKFACLLRTAMKLRNLDVIDFCSCVTRLYKITSIDIHAPFLEVTSQEILMVMNSIPMDNDCNNKSIILIHDLAQIKNDSITEDPSQYEVMLTTVVPNVKFQGEKKKTKGETDASNNVYEKTPID